MQTINFLEFSREEIEKMERETGFASHIIEESIDHLNHKAWELKQRGDHFEIFTAEVTEYLVRDLYYSCAVMVNYAMAKTLVDNIFLGFYLQDLSTRPSAIT